MSATEQHVKEQCKRLAAVPLLVPNDIDPRTGKSRGKAEIADALMRNCQSNEHVTDVITRFLETEEDTRNIVAALIRIARNTRRADEPPPGCDRCALGPDEFTGEMRWAPHVGIDSGLYSYATRCGCERGRWLRARDLEGANPERRQPKPKHEHPTDADWQRRAAGDAK